MHPSVARVHSHGGIRHDLAFFEELLTLFPQQGQVLLLGGVPNGDSVLLHIKPRPMKNTPRESVDEVGELIANASPRLCIEVELA